MTVRQIYTKSYLHFQDTGKYFNKFKQSNAILPAKCRISDYLNKQKCLEKRTDSDATSLKTRQQQKRKWQKPRASWLRESGPKASCVYLPFSGDRNTLVSEEIEQTFLVADFLLTSSVLEMHVFLELF